MIWTLGDEKAIEDSEVLEKFKKNCTEMELGVLYCPPSSRSRGLQPSLALIPLRFIPLNSVLIALSQPTFSQVSCFSDALSSSIGESQTCNFSPGLCLPWKLYLWVLDTGRRPNGSEESPF